MQHADAPSPVQIERLAASLFDYLCLPRTDIIDVLAVALGEASVACLYVREAALEPACFRRLVVTSMACGVGLMDINGNIGRAEEYAREPSGHVPIWLAGRSLAALYELCDAHQRLQPRGFASWAAYLGRALGYPECCIEAYLAQVRSPGDLERYWRDRAALARSRGELMVNFAPCSADCRLGQAQTLRRLRVAKRLNLLDEAAVAPWLRRVGQTTALDDVQPTLDLSHVLAGFRVPRVATTEDE